MPRRSRFSTCKAMAAAHSCSCNWRPTLYGQLRANDWDPESHRLYAIEWLALGCRYYLCVVTTHGKAIQS